MDADLNPMPLVLMYHSVEPYTEDPYQVTVDPRRFERQLRWLRRRGLRGVSMRTLLSAPGPGLVGLTFDDGYADFLGEVMPLLAAFDFTATVYVVAGSLGGHNSWDEPGPRKALMTAEDVRTVAAAGMEIGSHGFAHVRMTSADDLALHTVRSREILEESSGQDVTGFCYPYGAVGAREVEAVRAAGYDYACAVRPAPVAGRHAIPRTFIGDRDASPRLYAKLARHRLTVGRAA
ncbi:polysaccharide deacetylase family protein [Actinoplanes sp. NBRC 103695]|uniref:polysaccharide deacetylase family protein n=1 Tax=Actinoplanes sp. NBRC 103695 TaxID=3032202 RepID=UPI0024A13F2B|nr:polysaccharide deacetylase family protein [Actinoplanes sp. NBRC 103695]GLY94197.1 polysaccharide deacetylase [Actinoplanes sp. NBRC 103695]